GAPQPFFRYLPASWKPGAQLPLLVYLHGFNNYDLFFPPAMPAAFSNIAERAGAAVAVPFGRSNTDFQGVGEQDVFAVVEEMRQRYGTDPDRVVLAGYSMGAMGAWQIAGRWPERFSALLAVAGRGDFYTWQDVEPAQLPEWQRALIASQFAINWTDRLSAMPILAFNGGDDTLVPPREGRVLFDSVPDANPNAQCAMVPGYDHHQLAAYFTNETVLAWLEERLGEPPPRRTAFFSKARPPSRPGATGSRAQDFFLDPFVIVGNPGDDAVRAAISAWYSLTKSLPRVIPEKLLTPRQQENFSLLIPAAPEDSPLAARLFASLGITFTDGEITVTGHIPPDKITRVFPREGRGFWIAGPHPDNIRLSCLVNFGVPWGLQLSPNHYYDRIPDFICYTAETGAFGLPIPEAVAFLRADGRLYWSDPPATPFSLNPAMPAY
ncbi:MAG: S9 family peptidase, partial [Kiritimatiellaeota bacterium]|nr:S9 family peptidase [Kiritimatiellota bacterium]